MRVTHGRQFPGFFELVILLDRLSARWPDSFSALEWPVGPPTKHFGLIAIAEFE
jgi:hypothetical protein